MNTRSVSVMVPTWIILAICVSTFSCIGDHARTANHDQASATGQGERCARHGLPVAMCFICDAALRDPGRLWCEEHERYEDRCFLCHPELKDEERLWCNEHNLYEDECVLCHPEFSRAEQRFEPAGDVLDCQEHGVREQECGICHPELASALKPGSGLKIRFESGSSAIKAGVETAKPQVSSSLHDLAVLSRVTYDQNLFVRVTPLASGVVQRVVADVGLSVSRGELLATVSSPEIARVKSEYLSARAEQALKRAILEREQVLVAKKISARQDYEQAQAEHEIAKNETASTRQQLLNFGLTEDAIHHLEQTGAASSSLDIHAPFDGIIIDRHAVVGEAVAPGEALFEIADLSSMWLDLSIPEDELPWVHIDQPVVATFDAHPGMEVSGRLTWVASSVEEESRTVRARVVVSNPNRLLKHGMFGQARLLAKSASDGLYVPAGAVQRVDGQPYVFTRLDDDLYELRRVALGATADNTVMIRAGVTPEDEIVVAHSFILKSEFLKSRLGAGCAGE